MHYELGPPYKAAGIWWYPRESYAADVTGLASVLPREHTSLTSDGEVYDPSAMAAAHPTLQLPAIARIINLENGRSVVVRVNDRGQPTPHRLVQVTSGVAELLGIPEGGAAQVRMIVLPAESHAAADDLPGAPVLPIAAAPRAVVQSAELPPPPGARGEAGRIAPTRIAAAELTDTPAPALDLPKTVTQGPPKPGRLWVRLDVFQSYHYAAAERAKLFALAPRIVPVSEGRARSFRVMLGPFSKVADADAALDRAIGAGVPDARIVVE